jgi:hypothetical protein
MQLPNMPHGCQTADMLNQWKRQRSALQDHKTSSVATNLSRTCGHHEHALKHFQLKGWSAAGHKSAAYARTQASLEKPVISHGPALLSAPHECPSPTTACVAQRRPSEPPLHRQQWSEGQSIFTACVWHTTCQSGLKPKCASREPTTVTPSPDRPSACCLFSAVPTPLSHTQIQLAP